MQARNTFGGLTYISLVINIHRSIEVLHQEDLILPLSPSMHLFTKISQPLEVKWKYSTSCITKLLKRATLKADLMEEGSSQLRSMWWLFRELRSNTKLPNIQKLKPLNSCWHTCIEFCQQNCILKVQSYF